MAVNFHAADTAREMAPYARFPVAVPILPPGSSRACALACGGTADDQRDFRIGGISAAATGFTEGRSEPCLPTRTFSRNGGSKDAQMV